jgi:uncharacterized protein (TIGR00369 family)
VRTDFLAKDPGFERRVRDIFQLQTAMRTIGATIEKTVPGTVELRMPFNAQFVQQHGYMHAAISTMLVDTACGCAAVTLTPPGSNVITIEYKVNFLNPGRGESFLATGKVIKPGRTLIVCAGEVVAFDAEGSPTAVASMLTTLMILAG